MKLLTVSSNAEMGEVFRQNQSLSVNFQGNNFKLYTDYSFYDGKDFIKINSSRYYSKNEISEPASVRLDMQANRRFHSLSNYFKTGIEYDFSKKVSADVHLQGNWFGREKNEAAQSDFFENDFFTQHSLHTTNVQEVKNRNLGVSAGIQYKMNPKLKWDNVVNFLSYTQDEELNQKSTMADYNNSLEQHALMGNMTGKNDILNVQSVMAYNKSDKFTFQSGAKVSSIAINSNALYNSFEPGGWIQDKELSSGFKYQENIWAGFLQAAQKWSERFSTEAGLRLEHTNTEAGYVSESRDSTLVRHYNQLFPSIAINYILTEGHTISFQYGRRIVRPNYRDLNPFTEVNDFYLQERGNTALRPELLNNLEVLWLLKSKHMLSMFYTVRQNPITKSYLTEPDSGITIVMPLNLKQSYTTGFKASINTLKPTKWWTSYFNGSLTYKEFYWQESGNHYKNSLLTPSLQLNNQFELLRNWAFEITGYLNGTSAEGQAKIDAIGALSIGVRKNFFDNKLSLYTRVFFIACCSLGSLIPACELPFSFC